MICQTVNKSESQSVNQSVNHCRFNHSVRDGALFVYISLLDIVLAAPFRGVHLTYAEVSS